jgi:acetyl-CoA carboxylase biotin carboxyl carrier protein
MDHRELKKLVQLMNDNGLVELEVEEQGLRVLLRKAGAGVTAVPAVPMIGAVAAPGLGTPGAPATPGSGNGLAGAAGEAPPARPPGTKDICSPMVGTFYRRPSPDSQPYVNVGDRVKNDTVVCIVEAMKVNNEIKAEMDGELLEILVEDGHPVEFDQPLFRVRVE